MDKLDLKDLSGSMCFIISCYVELGDETKDVSNLRVDDELLASILRFIT